MASLPSFIIPSCNPHFPISYCHDHHCPEDKRDVGENTANNAGWRRTGNLNCPGPEPSFSTTHILLTPDSKGVFGCIYTVRRICMP